MRIATQRRLFLVHNYNDSAEWNNSFVFSMIVSQFDMHSRKEASGRVKKWLPNEDLLVSSAHVEV